MTVVETYSDIQETSLNFREVLYADIHGQDTDRALSTQAGSSASWIECLEGSAKPDIHIMKSGRPWVDHVSTQVEFHGGCGDGNFILDVVK